MNMQKHIRTLILLLAIVLFTTIGSTPASAASAGTPPPIPTTGDIWDGSIEQPTTLVQKDGIYYYEITKCSQLAYVAQTGGDWLTYNYILENNLILNDVVLTWDEEGNCTNTETLLEWMPISDFSGTFRGNGHTISGIYITRESENYRYDSTGFFRELTWSGKVAEINSVAIVNSYISGTGATGGLVGHANGTILNCSIANSFVSGPGAGGLVGQADGTISNCSIANSFVSGTGATGGLVGHATETISNCSITNSYVRGTECTGGLVGIAGAATIIDSASCATVLGTGQVGGIVGNVWHATVYSSYNYGDITGNTDVGGIGGSSSYARIKNCYNLGDISGNENVGGIAGNAKYSNFLACYNAGTVNGSTNQGAVIGNSDHFFGERSEITNCYYLKDSAHNFDPFGNVSGDTFGVAEGLTDTQMKQQASFVNWDFDQTWSIAPTKNGGYPYLSWQTPGAIPVSGVSLNKKTLSLAVGDQEYLTATVSPVTADNSSCIWASSNDQVASVNQSGKVTAIAPGSAEISVATQDGGYTAVCAVTVQGRTQNEYRINSVALRDSNGELLRQIPAGSFWASVSITNQTSSGDTLVLLVSYDTNGKYLDMMCVQARDLPVGATIELSLLMKNSTAQTASVKAFLISSLTDLTPIGEAVSWQP